ncbi:nickel pincer cofactor biosynthesis protein LarB [Halomarina litorea]|uniref:nickel pincer cofactor biosynthesis protein LarB n=1 Tax=Halomarina litorea TaxID=2961595 RepID=UPI0020C3260B|nr:nickel pincer cofactor biosynthesis protein LarB [Halomarina sp. BCD28]
MRELLDAVADGTLSPAAAEAELRGYATDEAGRFDAAREERAGVPEAILAEGKTPDEAATLTATAVETTNRALVTRADDATARAIRAAVTDEFPGATVDRDARARTVVVHGEGYEPPALDARVAVVAAGTADAEPAGEAAVTMRELGATVTRIDDVGVAGLPRLLDALGTVREHDVVVVAAGREGALPTVLAGQVDVPVVGLPVSTGYGHGGRGEAALAGLLQSCAPLAVVNIDAGFAAAVHAGRIARLVDSIRRAGRSARDSNRG